MPHTTSAVLKRFDELAAQGRQGAAMELLSFGQLRALCSRFAPELVGGRLGGRFREAPPVRFASLPRCFLPRLPASLKYGVPCSGHVDALLPLVGSALPGIAASCRLQPVLSCFCRRRSCRCSVPRWRKRFCSRLHCSRPRT